MLKKEEQVEAMKAFLAGTVPYPPQPIAASSTNQPLHPVKVSKGNMTSSSKSSEQSEVTNLTSGIGNKKSSQWFYSLRTAYCVEFSKIQNPGS
ncbi:unnamed protein product [Thelazia callipaeda]|uniref:Ovule protein n=1 Tax=Thelazia callipaeda TaxID=103827 RepID=A0A0N5CRQ7_THECL|nr:unnamed protein product [Thelazia callipaeda]